MKNKMKFSLRILECLWKNKSLTFKSSSKFFISLNNQLGVKIKNNKEKETRCNLPIQLFNNHNHNHKYLSQKSNHNNNNSNDNNNHKSSSNNLNKSNKTLEQTSFKIRYPRSKISWISLLTSVEGFLIYFSAN